MKTHTTTIRRSIPPVIVAGIVLSAGILSAQEPGKGKKQRQPKGDKLAQAVLRPPFQEAWRLPATNGKVDWPLHAVFGEVPVPGIPPSIDADGKIYVRSYTAPKPPQAVNDQKDQNDRKDARDSKNPKAPAGQLPPMIPGPTFVFNPGDLLRLRFHNLLNRTLDPALNSFQNNPQEAGPAASDDTDEHVSHEISIPNDSNVTNLHVHGLELMGAKITIEDGYIKARVDGRLKGAHILMDMV